MTTAESSSTACRPEPSRAASCPGSADAIRADRLRLASLPTPLEPLERVTALLGRPRIWVKRDDCTGLGGGGNKVRKLEFLFGAAEQERADVVVTSGAVQSNHARLTAAASARVGLACELLLARRVDGRGASYERSGNLLLDRLFGARVELLEAGVDAEGGAARRADELRADGARPYLVAPGGSTAVGALGYVACAEELLTQAAAAGASVGAIVVATASAETLAGLSVGLAKARWTGRLIGVAVSAPADVARSGIAPLTRETAAFVGHPDLMVDAEIEDGWLGPGYGVPTRECLEAVRLFAGSEGLLLDPVYTGKAAAALIARIRERAIVGDDVVFVHTGGWPALFGYQEDF
jgi:L-cysteate sulfo-lyase